MWKPVKYVTVLAAGVAVTLAASAPASAKVEGDFIIFGAALSFTGKYSTNGKHTKNGYELAAKRINEMGGIKVGGKSYKVKIQYYDDESTPARTAQIGERLIVQDGIKFILGPYGSGPTTGLAPVTEKYKISMVEGNGASRGLFNKGYKYIFRGPLDLGLLPEGGRQPRRRGGGEAGPQALEPQGGDRHRERSVSRRTSATGSWRTPRSTA